MDKLTASQRLDLNLEKGRMRDELQMVRDKSNELEIKVRYGTAPGRRWLAGTVLTKPDHMLLHSHTP